VVFLILESLGSTELLFILVMALVFFGPRKLPQLSRTLGKNIADFRRASEDFKRTWDREVSLEESGTPANVANPALTAEGNSILGPGATVQSLQAPTIETVSPDRVIARNSAGSEMSNPVARNEALQHDSDPGGSNNIESPSSPKHDWL